MADASFTRGRTGLLMSIFFCYTEYTIQQAQAQAVSISCKPAWWAYEAWAAGSVSMTAVAPAATTEGRKDTLSMPSSRDGAWA